MGCPYLYGTTSCPIQVLSSLLAAYLVLRVIFLYIATGLWLAATAAAISYIASWYMQHVCIVLVITIYFG